MDASVETFRSLDMDPTLFTVCWTANGEQDVLWKKLFAILRAIAASQPELGTISFGELTLGLTEAGSSQGRDIQHWRLDFTPDGIARLEQQYRTVRSTNMILAIPYSIQINVQPFVFLPVSANEIKVFNFDIPDWEIPWSLPIEPAHVPGLKGFRRWQVVNHSTHLDTTSDLHIELDFELDEKDCVIALDVRSRLDLWHPKRFDGSSNHPIGSYNFRHLAKIFSDIADRTSGKMVFASPQANQV